MLHVLSSMLQACDNWRAMPSKAHGKDPLNMFAEAARERAKIHAPLAARMRPRTLEEFVG